MKELNELQKNMLNNWITSAEKDSLKLGELSMLDNKLSALINNLEKPVSHFPRLI